MENIFNKKFIIQITPRKKARRSREEIAFEKDMAEIKRKRKAEKFIRFLESKD